jgi:hypothetical protein
MFCGMAGDFLDLRQVPDHLSLDPDPDKAYPAGNTPARDCLFEGLNGIIYPSVRHEEGTCIVALRPAAVQSVRQGGVHRMVRSGKPKPEIYRLE